MKKANKNPNRTRTTKANTKTKRKTNAPKTLKVNQTKIWKNVLLKHMLIKASHSLLMCVHQMRLSIFKEKQLISLFCPLLVVFEIQSHRFILCSCEINRLRTENGAYFLCLLSLPRLTSIVLTPT